VSGGNVGEGADRGDGPAPAQEAAPDDDAPPPLAAATPSPAVAKPAGAPAQPKNPLHGVTLQAVVERLVERYGWDGLGERVPLKCFLNTPSVASSLRFLRKTPWAREKVEGLYLFMRREQARQSRS